MSYYFDRQKAVGKIAEAAVKEHLINRGHTINDVSEDQQYQKIDTDFIVYKDNQVTTLEVKVDNSYKKTGNIFIEDYAVREGKVYDGWLHYCEANYIAYYDTVRKCGMIVNYPLIKSLLDKAFQRVFYDREDQKEKHCLLLPRKYAEQANAIVYEWQE